MSASRGFPTRWAIPAARNLSLGVQCVLALREALMDTSGMGPILIVEDDDDVRMALKQAIEDEGHFAFEASNGREALEMLETCRPSLILLDMMMPVMNGAEFLRVLRDDGRLPALPVVIITAQARNAEMDGARFLMHKPISADGLAAVIRTLVPNQYQHG